jgi:cell division protease FtsH
VASLALTIRKRAASTLQRRVTFDDLAGIGEAMDELPEIIDVFLRVPTATCPSVDNAPRRALVPPPGTGNALVACAGAG